MEVLLNVKRFCNSYDRFLKKARKDSFRSLPRSKGKFCDATESETVVETRAQARKGSDHVEKTDQLSSTKKTHTLSSSDGDVQAAPKRPRLNKSKHSSQPPEPARPQPSQSSQRAQPAQSLVPATRASQKRQRPWPEHYEPLHTPRALNVGIRKILHNNEETPQAEIGKSVKVRCFLAVYCPTVQIDDYGFQKTFLDELYRTSEDGSMDTVLDDSGQPVTHLQLPGPFVIPAKKLEMPARRIENPISNTKQGQGHVLSSEYNFQIWFQPLDFQGWPPLGFLDRLSNTGLIAGAVRAHPGVSDSISMISTMKSVLLASLEQEQEPTIGLRLNTHTLLRDVEPTKLSISVNIRWSEPITPPQPKPKRIKISDPVEVTWCISRQGTQIEKARTRSYGCYICGSHTTSQTDIYFHLVTEHGNWGEPKVLTSKPGEPKTLLIELITDPELFAANGNRSMIQVEPALDAPPGHNSTTAGKPSTEDATIFQRKPTTRKRPRRIKNSQIGEDTEDDNSTPAVTSAPVSSVNSPDTTPTTLSKIPANELFTDDTARPSPPVVLVPYTKTTLYDHTTHQRLIPGTTLPPLPEYPKWLLWLHRQTIHDFSDVTNDEKDFIVSWNDFIVQVPGSYHWVYMARDLECFVSERLEWLKERRSRMVQLGLFMTALQLQGRIDIECRIAIMKILMPVQAYHVAQDKEGNARKKKEDEEKFAKEIAAQEEARKEGIHAALANARILATGANQENCSPNHAHPERDITFSPNSKRKEARSRSAGAALPNKIVPSRARSSTRTQPPHTHAYPADKSLTPIPAPAIIPEAPAPIATRPPKQSQIPDLGRPRYSVECICGEWAAGPGPNVHCTHPASHTLSIPIYQEPQSTEHGKLLTQYRNARINTSTAHALRIPHRERIYGNGSVAHVLRKWRRASWSRDERGVRFRRRFRCY
jgi:hypothetical protein